MACEVCVRCWAMMLVPRNEIRWKKLRSIALSFRHASSRIDKWAHLCGMLKKGKGLEVVPVDRKFDTVLHNMVWCRSAQVIVVLRRFCSAARNRISRDISCQFLPMFSSIESAFSHVVILGIAGRIASSHLLTRNLFSVNIVCNLAVHRVRALHLLRRLASVFSYPSCVYHSNHFHWSYVRTHPA